MSSKFILIWHDGRITSRTIRKPHQRARASYEWLGEGAALALRWKAKHFAMRLDGEWHVLPVSGPPSIAHRFPAANKAAAEMWLIAREFG